MKFLLYAGVLAGLHLFVITSIPVLFDALGIRGLFAQNAFAVAAVLFIAEAAALHFYGRRLKQQAWLDGYSTGHWDGLEDSGEAV